jgi:predicted RND superfamily exporter protein
MERFSGGVIRRRRWILALFLAAAVVSAGLFLTVRVNYDMADYLPPGAQSTEALRLMTEGFPEALPNAEAAAPNLSLMQALQLKQDLLALPRVSAVLWLDDLYDLKTPLELADPELLETYFDGGTATYTLTIEKGHEQEGVRAVRALLEPYGGVLNGEAAGVEFVQSASESEVVKAMVILLPIILLILILSTSSWLEPLLFLAAIGVSVVINMGTNAMFGEVSFLTNAVTPILQLAVSLDYAIFLLHSFADRRAGGADVAESMRGAVKESFSAVAASASTTLFGFAALLFMDFRLGADLGLSLAKGIALSFVSVMVFLPALTLCVYKLIDRTHHRPLTPSFGGVYKILGKLGIPAVILVLLMLVPSYMGQSRTDFLYGYQAAAERLGGQTTEDSAVMALLVPRGDVAREQALGDALLQHERVTSVTSYAATVGSGVPAGFLEQEITGQFYSDTLSRLIVYTDTAQEGDDAFRAVEEITAIAETYYPGQVHSVGSAANLYDIRTVVRQDNLVTSLIAIGTIFLVLAVTFRSLTLPFLLLLTIQSAIWINLSIPYFTGTPINYIGYLVLNTVQLGATVDYAILLTVTYLRKRRSLPKKQAMSEALGSSFRSILVSAFTLATAGFTLAGTSSNPLIGDIGGLLGRGTLLSMVLVVVFLPALLVLFDKVIAKTTYKPGFLEESR